jgi:hypothetical protein
MCCAGPALIPSAPPPATRRPQSCGASNAPSVLSGGAAGYNAPITCSRFFSYLWWHTFYNLTVWLLAAATLAGGLSRFRPGIVVLLAISLMQALESSNNWLYFDTLPTTSSAFTARAKVRTKPTNKNAPPCSAPAKFQHSATAAAAAAQPRLATCAPAEPLPPAAPHQVAASGAIIKSVGLFFLIGLVGYRNEESSVFEKPGAPAGGKQAKKGAGAAAAPAGPGVSTNVLEPEPTTTVAVRPGRVGEGEGTTAVSPV